MADWQRGFSKERVITLLYEDLMADPQAFVDRVCAFADIPAIQLSPEQLAPVHSSETSVIPRHPAWTRLGVSVGNWIYDHEWEAAVAVVKRLRLRRWFLELGSRFPKLEREVEHRMRRKLMADIEALESILGRDLGMWKPAP
ncbi:MAG TPA: sulfotransferase [Candidatus Binataceae bacterium]|nr:sulfotransferase [Candidatus Binataceae bacterium]